MDQSVKLPAQTNSQFLAQLPELAEELLSLSNEFEVGMQSQLMKARMTEGLRGWGVLEKLARESLHERGRDAARARAESERAEALATARQQKPFVPTRKLTASLQTKAVEALQDPSVVAALVQWSRKPQPPNA